MYILQQIYHFFHVFFFQFIVFCHKIVTTKFDVYDPYIMAGTVPLVPQILFSTRHLLKYTCKKIDKNPHYFSNYFQLIVILFDANNKFFLCKKIKFSRF